MFFKKKAQENKTPEKPKALPKHIAIDLEGVGRWAEEQQVPFDEAYAQSFALVRGLIEEQIRLNIPLLTFFVMSPNLKGTEQADVLVKQCANFLEHVGLRDRIVEHKVKVTVLGKWYDLSQRIVEAIRKIAEETKGYDSFFVNLCMNYDGQEEIVDACKIIARKIKIGKIDPEAVTKDLVKENLSSSYFIPPDLIIRNGREKIISSLLLWDSPGARIHFTGKLFPELSVEDFRKIVG